MLWAGLGYTGKVLCFRWSGGKDLFTGRQRNAIGLIWVKTTFTSVSPKCPLTNLQLWVALESRKPKRIQE